MKPKPIYLITTLIALLVLGTGCGEKTVISPTQKTEYFTSDIDLFWALYDNHLPTISRQIIQNEYIDKGSIGLKDYDSQKNLVSSLASRLKLEEYQSYYTSIRHNTVDLDSVILKVDDAIFRLKAIYPNTKFTNVYFLVGALSAGGRVSNNGLLIAVEMFSKTETTNTENLGEWLNSVTRTKSFLPSIVLHELIHFQQKAVSNNNLLEQSIKEGMADYLSKYLLPNEPFMNHHLHTFGDSIEFEIWNKFKIEMDLPYNNTEWLYSGKSTLEGYPADMGYYVGFKIVESYVASHNNEKEAIQEMLSERDYISLFEHSNYLGN